MLKSIWNRVWPKEQNPKPSILADIERRLSKLEADQVAFAQGVDSLCDALRLDIERRRTVSDCDQIHQRVQKQAEGKMDKSA